MLSLQMFHQRGRYFFRFVALEAFYFPVEPMIIKFTFQKITFNHTLQIFPFLVLPEWGWLETETHSEYLITRALNLKQHAHLPCEIKLSKNKIFCTDIIVGLSNLPNCDSFCDSQYYSLLYTLYTAQMLDV